MMTLRISDVTEGMKNVQIAGKILNMNTFMLVIDDGSGQIFVRYNQRHITNPLNKGDYVTVQNCKVVKYSGILQTTMQRNGQVLVQSNSK